jgi:hypothetical protein
VTIKDSSKLEVIMQQSNYQRGLIVMRKLTVLLFLIALIVVIPAASAGSDTVNVNLTLSDPSLTLSDCGGLCGTIYYEEYSLNVSASGNHTINISNLALSISGAYWNLYPQCGFSPTNFRSRITGSYNGSVNLTAGTYTLVLTTIRGTSGNGGAPNLGSYDFTVTGPGSVSITGNNCGAVGSNPDGDPDGDGIPSHRDNCRYDYNPSQEDGWAGPAGDLCDQDWYNRTGQGVAGFEQKDGIYHLHGNCLYLDDGAPRCPVVGSFDPSSLTPGDAPMEVTTGDAGTWSVWVHYLHSKDGVAVYQVNTYNTNPPQPDTLVDDRLEFHVAEGGSWQWRMRGGDRDYNGI